MGLNRSVRRKVNFIFFFWDGRRREKRAKFLRLILDARKGLIMITEEECKIILEIILDVILGI